MEDREFAGTRLAGYGLIRLPLSDLAARLNTLNTSSSQRWLLSQRSGVSPLRHVLPLSLPARRYAFVPLGDSWSAVIDNGRDGSDFGDLQRRFRPWHDVLTLRVVDQPDRHVVAHGYRERVSYAARILAIHGDGLDRSIVCANDGGRWTFETSGEPLPVEDTSTYDARPLSGRFTTENLKAILRSLEARPVTYEDLLAPSRWIALEIVYADREVQERMVRNDCTPDEAADPAFGYWRRAQTWIEHIDTHAQSAVADLTRAVALNPAYGKRARRHLKRARKILGAQAFGESVALGRSGLEAAR